MFKGIFILKKKKKKDFSSERKYILRGKYFYRLMLRSNYRQAYILFRVLSYVKIELCKQNSLHR